MWKDNPAQYIGGLDRYTSGDLSVNGRSTKNFTDLDYDEYRNRSIGFVFQNYNLISHQTVLANVEPPSRSPECQNQNAEEGQLMRSHRLVSQTSLKRSQINYPEDRCRCRHSESSCK